LAAKATEKLSAVKPSTATDFPCLWRRTADKFDHSLSGLP